MAYWDTKGARSLLSDLTDVIAELDEVLIDSDAIENALESSGDMTDAEIDDNLQEATEGLGDAIWKAVKDYVKENTF